MKRKIRRFTTVFLVAVFFCILIFFCLHLLFPLRIKDSWSQVITSSDGKVLHAFLSSDEKWRMKAEGDEIPEKLKKAILEKEDKYFYYHPGVNFFAVGRAAFNNQLSGRKTSGASTITMQVVRMLEPKKRTYLNKFIEIFRAFQLELLLSKDEILQLYFNLVPYGGNIEGVKAASILYFGKPTDHLSLAQLTVLTIIPNRPTSLRPGKNDDFLTKERNKWLRRFKQELTFPSEEIEDAIREPLRIKRLPAPKFAPHFSIRMGLKHPELPNVPTTLRWSVQERVENITRNYSNRLRRMNINNAAVIVINNSTHEVEAYVGSSDFSDSENAGQVDGIRAVRSPGSTLKPLIYGAAFDAGIVTPKHVLSDVPTDFGGGYSPENFDKNFNGKITVETSLSHSLNVPAVKVLEQLGVKPFIDKLKQAGFVSVSKQERRLGLSIALGGCGVTLEELGSLFSSFANSGEVHKIRYLKGDTSGSIPVSIISPSSAYVVTEILTQITRPDLPNHYQNTYRVPKVAWKTGTSYGRRDAWSIGYNKRFTIGVWVGNFSGESVPELTGADIATPLLFEIFNTIDYNASDNWFIRPQSLKFRYVCNESGMPPGDLCENHIMDFFIPGISTPAKCEHLKYVFVSPDEKISYCMQCLPSSGYKKKVYPNIPPELLAFYRRQRIAYSAIPDHNYSCNRVFTENAPMITSPSDAQEYFLEKEDPALMMLSCNAEAEVKKVFWYINNKFFKEAKASESIFFQAPEGRVKISCTDDKGRNSDSWIVVKYY